MTTIDKLYENQVEFQEMVDDAVDSLVNFWATDDDGEPDTEIAKGYRRKVNNIVSTYRVDKRKLCSFIEQTACLRYYGR